MKAMILVLSPKESCDLLNGNLSVLARKRFPKDYVGQVYVYVTKGKPYLYRGMKLDNSGYHYYTKEIEETRNNVNGKVVARFWCDKVETIFAKPDRYKEFYFYNTDKLDMEDLLKQSCLEYNELDVYLDANNGYAIRITKLEIFDKPKEISEFYKVGYENEKQKIKPNSKFPLFGKLALNHIESEYQLTCAPRCGWCYIDKYLENN